MSDPIENFRTLFDYNRWATDRLIAACVTLPPDDVARTAGVSHGSLLGTLVHIWAAERVWLERWNGSSPAGLPGMDAISSLETLRAAWAELRAEHAVYLDGLTEAKLAAPLAYRDTKGNPYTQRLEHQLQHVINHSTYHRGQVAGMLRQLGVQPPATDLIVYYRERA